MKMLLFLTMFTIATSVSGKKSSVDVVVPTNELNFTGYDFDSKESLSKKGDSFVMTANDVYFSPSGTFRNVEDVSKKGQGGIQNGGRYFTHVTNWRNLTDTLIWIVDVAKVGKLSITPTLAVPEEQAGSVVEVLLISNKRVIDSKTINLKATGDATTFKPQDMVRLDVPTTGRYLIGMKIKSAIKSKNVANVEGISISGNASEKSKPVLLRWRPAAAHTGWKSTQNPDSIVMAVFEVTMSSKEVDSYSPITTPFGYFGSTWITKSQKFGGINFSLWTRFDKGNKPPSPDKFSHLIAVGNGMYIDGFNHEGTGVKPRGENPYENISGVNTQVLAVSKVPGIPMDTYYSYYLDLKTRKWVLFGCGKTYNHHNKINYLWTGAFVEMPGPPIVRRCGHLRREIQFSGWFMDEAGKWYPIDRMTPGGKIEPNSYKNWGVKGDKFFMQMGGIEPILESRPKEFIIDKSKEPMPDYLSGESLKDLFKFPATIKMVDAGKIASKSAVVKFNVPDMGTNPIVTLYYGDNDGLTFAKDKNGKDNRGSAGVVNWDFNVVLSNKVAGEVSYNIQGLNPKTKYYYRLQINNDEGETWSFDTQSFTTK